MQDLSTNRPNLQTRFKEVGGRREGRKGKIRRNSADKAKKRNSSVGSESIGKYDMRVGE